MRIYLIWWESFWQMLFWRWTLLSLRKQRGWKILFLPSPHPRAFPVFKKPHLSKLKGIATEAELAGISASETASYVIGRQLQNFLTPALSSCQICTEFSKAHLFRTTSQSRQGPLSWTTDLIIYFRSFLDEQAPCFLGIPDRGWDARNAWWTSVPVEGGWPSGLGFLVSSLNKNPQGCENHSWFQNSAKNLKQQLLK